MTAPAIYVCPGCREPLSVEPSPPLDESRPLACPAVECGRPVWAVSDAHGLRLCTDDAPDLGAARYVRDRGRVLDHGQELLSVSHGPHDRLDGLVRALNQAALEDWEVAEYVRAFIEVAGGLYHPGPALIRSGELAQRRGGRSSRENPPCPNHPDSSVGAARSRSASRSPMGTPSDTSVPRRDAG